MQPDLTYKIEIADLARTVIAEIAPEEQDLFDDYAADYFADPSLTRLRRPTADEPLASGIPDIIHAMSPIVLAATTTVVTFLAKEILEITRAGTTDVVKDHLKKLLNKKISHTEQSNLAFPPEQLARVRAAAYEQARAFDVDARTANRIADVLVGKLAVRNSHDGNTDLLKELLRITS